MGRWRLVLPLQVLLAFALICFGVLVLRLGKSTAACKAPATLRTPTNRLTIDTTALEILRSIHNVGMTDRSGDEAMIRLLASLNETVTSALRLEYVESTEEVKKLADVFARLKTRIFTEMKEKPNMGGGALVHSANTSQGTRGFCNFPPTFFLDSRRTTKHFKPIANSRRRKMIVIVTEMRSGSSFVGRIFERSPDVLYFFEPLQGISFIMKSKPNANLEVQLQSDLLSSIASCNFETQLGVKLVDDVSRSAYYPRNVTEAFMKPPFCPDECLLRYNRCPAMETKQVGELCASRLAVVVKVIRLERISDLETAVLPDNVDLHVLHLVRDPRATIFSRYNIRGQLMKHYTSRNGDTAPREEVSNNTLVASEAEALCSALRKKFDFIESRRGSDWLVTTGRYQLVTFEEIAASPFVVGKRLLESYGLEFGASVTNWLKENTKLESNNLARKNPYATKRNSEQIVDAWKAFLKEPSTRELVGLIESKCTDVLKKLNFELLVQKK